MPWHRLSVADDAEAVEDVMHAFAAAWKADGQPMATALFGAQDRAGRWTLLAMGTTPPAVAEVMERFGFTAGYARMPAGLRLLVGQPIAARVLAPNVKRSRSWWAEARAGRRSRRADSLALHPEKRQDMRSPIGSSMRE